MSDTKSIVRIKAEERTNLAYKYSFLAEELIEIKKGKALVWASLRAGVKSDTQAERTWQSTKDGIREMEITLTMKSLEKLISALKTEIETLHAESHNQY